MAGPWYVRSTDGDDASDGLSWANAKATLAGAFAAASAGDTIYVSDNHAETQSATNMTLSCPGSAAAPCRVLCVDDSAEPPTTLAATGSISVTTGRVLSITGSAYFYGIAFTQGSGDIAEDFNIGVKDATGDLVFDSCTLTLGGTNALQHLVIGNTPAQGNWAKRVKFVRCTFVFPSNGSTIDIGTAEVVFDDITIGGAVTPTTLLTGMSEGHPLCSVINSDLSGKSITNVMTPPARSSYRMTLRDCRLPGGIVLVSGSQPGPNCVVELINCDSADTNYRYQKATYQGNIYSETTVVRTGGASDGTTAHSRKMVSSAIAKFFSPLELGPLAIWNETTGSELTATVEIVTDNVTLTDAECWLEVEYLGTSGYPLSSFANDRAADIMATPANQATSTETWTTTGLTTPVKQKLSVTFTPQEKGLIRCRVMLAKASTTVYVCPKIELGATPVSTRQYQGSEYICEPLLPAAEDVESGVQYGAGGTEFTGTLVGGGGYTYGSNSAQYVLTTSDGTPGTYQPVAAADVQAGVAVGVSPAVGTFAVPAESIVKSGETYGDSAEFTGTYDPITGNYTDPGKANVLTGNDYYFGGVLQTAEYSPDFPIAAAVLDSDTVNGSPGTYHAPDAAEVISTAVFGPASGTSGTYDVANVSAGNIKKDVSIGGVTGTYDPMAAAVFPAEANVSTVETAYGPTGAEYAGSLNLSLYTLISGVVAAQYVLVGHDNYTGGDAGTFDESARNTDPGEANVVDGVTYKILNVAKEGTYAGGGGYTYGDNDPDFVLTTADGAGNYVPIADSDTVDGGVAYGVGEEGTGVNATTIRTALGMASGNLDAQLAAIVADTNELQAELADGGRTDLLIDGIKAKTDNLPASPAAVGSAMTLTEAYDAAKTAAQAGNAMALTSGERTTLAAATRDVMLDRVLAGNHDLAGSVGKLLQNCDAPISDVPTVAEFEARTIAAADYFVGGDYTAPPTTAQIKTELEANGSKLDHLWEMTEDDAGVRRLTQNALEQAPSGSGATAEEVWAHADRQLTSDGNIAVADATLTRDLKSITTTVTYCLYTFVMAALKSIVSGTSWLISKPSGVEHKSGTVTTDVNGNITGADLGDES